MKIKTNDIKAFISQLRVFWPASKMVNVSLNFDGQNITASGTDFILTVLQQIKATGNSFNGAALDIEQMEKIIRTDADYLDITQQDNDLMIDQAKIKAKTMLKNIWPDVSLFNPVSDKFTAIIQQSLKFTSQEKIKPSLNGVYINKGQIVATDSFDLMISKLADLADFEDLIIPNEVIKNLKASNPVTGIFIQDKTQNNPKMIYLRLASGTVVYARAIQQQYPNFKIIIPEGTDWGMVSRTELLNLIEQMLRQDVRYSVINSVQDKLCIEQPKKKAKAAVYKINSSGFDKKVKLAVDNQRLRRILKNLKTDEIYLQLTSPLQPLMVYADNSLFLNMPIRPEFI